MNILALNLLNTVVYAVIHTQLSHFESEDRKAVYWPPSPGPYLAPVPLQTQNFWLTPGGMSMAAEPYKGQQTV